MMFFETYICKHHVMITKLRCQNLQTSSAYYDTTNKNKNQESVEQQLEIFQDEISIHIRLLFWFYLFCFQILLCGFQELTQPRNTFKITLFHSTQFTLQGYVHMKKVCLYIDAINSTTTKIQQEISLKDLLGILGFLDNVFII